MSLDVWVRVADGASIVGDGIWCALGTAHDLLHLAELVGGFFSGDLVQCKLALGIVKKTEVLLGLLNLYNIHEASWEEHVGSCFAIDLDQSLHDDHLALTIGEGIFQ